MLASTIISRSLRTIGALGVGETAAASDAQDALTILNALIDGWRADRLTIDHLTRNEFTATATVGDYTLGPTGDWAYASVPTWIDHAGVILPSSDPRFEQTVEVVTPQRWEQQPLKTQSFSPVCWVYYERTAPNGTVHVWPVPDQTETVVLYLLAPLTQFAALTTDVDLPSGYADALVYNLAKRMCPEWGKALDPTLNELAERSLALIKSANVVPSELTTDEALWMGPWQINSKAAFLRGY